MKSAFKKQFLLLNGIPVLTRTVSVFNLLKEISGITVVVPEEDVTYTKDNIIDKFRLSKVKSVVNGGKDRSGSVWNGLLTVPESVKIVIVHDGVRPFVTERMIRNVIEEAGKNGAATVAVPTNDTIVSSENQIINRHLERSSLRNIQTPQAFHKKIIIDAYIKAAEEKFSGTDDTVMVHRLGKKVKLVEGSVNNIKLTTEIDFITAGELLKMENI